MTATAPRPKADSGLHSLGRRDWATWPKYEAAVLGFREYWYPVTWSRKVTKKPIQVTVLGEQIVLIRGKGVVRATGRAAVRPYPVEERLGLIWIYVGDNPPPPVETDMPSELLEPNTAVLGRITTREGNWRFGAENGFDDGHAKFLHRKTLWVIRRLMPAWTRIHVEDIGEGWITRVADEVHFETDYPNLGRWPKVPPWKSRGRGGAQTSIRLPAMLRVKYAKWSHFEWWVGRQPDQHIYVQLVAQQGGHLQLLVFRLYYWLWVRWVFHGLFNDEDRLMVDVMDAPPERLYRPDVSITEWRRLCETKARGRPQTPGDSMVPATSRRNVGGLPA